MCVWWVWGGGCAAALHTIWSVNGKGNGGTGEGKGLFMSGFSTVEASLVRGSNQLGIPIALRRGCCHQKYDYRDISLIEGRRGGRTAHAMPKGLAEGCIAERGGGRQPPREKQTVQKIRKT
eukprot:TRINITY_DN12512_c0_g1_i1.p1 TRINITY_DN12512_c0_g1~~TRINITY_DN12512_c0_g1_i1.p1  ORF type:complete len:121 (-),score=3.58 TRINITY_DN12512_c0_g1_i1:130-492(-)